MPAVAREDIIDEINLLFTRGTSPSDNKNDWYSFAFEIMTLINKQEESSSLELLNEFVLDHAIEMLPFSQKINLLNLIYKKEVLTEIEIKIKNYFNKQILRKDNLVGIFLVKDKKYRLFVLDKLAWREGESEELKDLAEKVKIKIDDIIINLAQFVGYISEFKTTGMVFKIKDTTSKRKKGARCDQSGKGNVITTINKIVGEERFTRENSDIFNISQMCVYEELILRFYNSIRENDKKWFLTPEEANIISI